MSKKIVLLVLVASVFAVALGQNVSYPPQPTPDGKSTTTPPPPTTTTTTTTTPKTTTSATTTTKPTTTTPPDTTTTPQPNTTTNTPPTTTSPSTTVSPSTTPAPPAPKPDVGSWKVVDPKTNNTCIIADMAMQLNVSYVRTDSNKTGHAIIIVPVNGTTATGDCGNVTQTVTLTWHPADVTLANMSNSIKLTFSRNETTKIVEVGRIDVVIQANVTEFVGIANFTTITLVNNQSEFSTSVGMSYLCSKVQSLNLTKEGTVAPIAIIEVSHLRVEAYREKKDDKFSAAKDCEPSSATDYIPIGVGCGLVALVAIVLIAYLIGRRRSQARGYLSIDDQGS